MTRSLIIAFVVVASVGCSKGSTQRTHQDIVKAYAAGVQSAGEIMDRMKDAASAEEGAKALRDETAKMSQLSAELSALGSISADEKKRCQEEYLAISTGGNKFAAAMKGLMDRFPNKGASLPEKVRDAVRDGVQEFSKASLEVTGKLEKIIR